MREPIASLRAELFSYLPPHIAYQHQQKGERRVNMHATSMNGTQSKLHVLTQPVSKTHTLQALPNPVRDPTEHGHLEQAADHDQYWLVSNFT